MMQNIYFEQLAALLTRTYPELATTHGLEFKNVFGAVGGYVRGRIFITSGNFGIALKLPQKTLESLFDKKVAQRLQYFPKGHIKKEYAILSERITKDIRQFHQLVNESVRYVLE